MVLFSLIGFIVVFFVAAYAYKYNENQKYEALAKEKAKLYEREYSFVMGNKDAKVQLVEFFDPACGTCAQFYPLVKQIMKEHEGKIKLVYRYAPFHQNSFYAVKMLEAAKEQGKFLEVLSFMFETQQYWIKNHVVQQNTLWRMLFNVQGIDMKKMADFMNNPELDARVEQDLKDAEALGATKTPSFFVNGKPLQTFGLEPLKELIQSEL